MLSLFNAGFYARQHMLWCVYAIARPSVCLSDRRVGHTKTVKDRIMKFSPYGSPIPLVFREQILSRNSEVFPRVGGGVGKIGDFRPLSRHISDTVGQKLLLIANRNVYMRFPLVPKSMTLSGP